MSSNTPWVCYAPRWMSSHGQMTKSNVPSFHMIRSIIIRPLFLLMPMPIIISFCQHSSFNTVSELSLLHLLVLSLVDITLPIIPMSRIHMRTEDTNVHWFDVDTIKSGQVDLKLSGHMTIRNVKSMWPLWRMMQIDQVVWMVTVFRFILITIKG